MSTTMERWSPLNEVDDLTTRMNRLFARMPWDGRSEVLGSSDWIPSCNVSEDAKEYRVRAELPAVRKDDVHVRLENGVLTIEGERKEEKEEKGITLHRREMSYGKFIRRFSLPEQIDEAKVRAVFEDGMLNVIAPKMKVAEPRSREIPVN